MNIKRIVVACLIILGASTSLFALKPIWNIYGYLVLQAENDNDRMHTTFWAITAGAETWLTKYATTIRGFVRNNPNYTYKATLPYYGYTTVTAENLTMVMYYDNTLGTEYMPYETRMQIQQALQTDHDLNGNYDIPRNYQWDPYSVWKWRSLYMEGRHSENYSEEDLNANCFGTADYLTRATQWVDGYDYYILQAQHYIDGWALRFPHIFLDGWQAGNDYSIDQDLATQQSWFTLVATGNLGSNVKNKLNSFDIIRMSSQPGQPYSAGHPEYEMWVGGQNIGQNLHSAAYICTDNSGKPWFYQKGNMGSTVNGPYDLHAFGQDPNWQYEGCFRSYFRHDSDMKLNYADSYEINWANVY